MGLFRFLTKSWRSMARPHTKWVELNGFNLTSHAQNRIADPKRNISKMDVVDHFFSKPLVETEASESKRDQSSEYYRIGKKLISPIATLSNNVKTIRRIGRKEIKSHNLKVDNPKKRTFKKDEEREIGTKIHR